MKIVLPLAAVAILGVVLPISAHASGTQFKGRIAVNINIVLAHALTGSQSLYCSASAVANDAGGEQFKAQSVIPAVQHSSQSYSCNVVVPYDWVNQNLSGDQTDMLITYQALILDSTTVFNNLGIGLQSASGNFKTPVMTTGQNITYSTPMSLY
jgi:hypothetical protein